ncbi:nucleotidyltransferase family protein [Roseivivax halodurans]
MMGKQARVARISILILAAGFGKRMRGADKLLMEVGGVPLLRRQAEEALAACRDVVVTLPAGAGARVAALEGLSVTRVAVADAGEGMAASIRAGIGALPEDAVAVMIVPGDMPELGRREFETLCGAFDPAEPCVIRGTDAGGAPGHPVLFPRRDFAALRAIEGDRGAREVLASAPCVVGVALPGRAALTDLDTPEAWASWREGREGGGS